MVIFIVGLLSGVAVLTLPGKDGDALLNQQRYDLLGALRNARAEAVFSGRSLGLVWRGSSGEFQLRTAEGWVPVEEGILARPLKLEAGVQAQISIAGEPLKIEDNTTEKDSTPQIIFLGDGQVSPFEWQLQTEGAESINFDQQLRVEE